MSDVIRVNGESHVLEVDNLADLLRSMEIDPGARGTAVAMNGEIVPRGIWDATRVRAGDDLEIVRPFAGG